MHSHAEEAEQKAAAYSRATLELEGEHSSAAVQHIEVGELHIRGVVLVNGRDGASVDGGHFHCLTALCHVCVEGSKRGAWFVGGHLRQESKWGHRQCKEASLRHESVVDAHIVPFACLCDALPEPNSYTAQHGPIHGPTHGMTSVAWAAQS